MQDTCGIHVSSEVIKIHAGYMRDTCVDTCRDTCGTRAGIRVILGAGIRVILGAVRVHMVPRLDLGPSSYVLSRDLWRCASKSGLGSNIDLLIL